MLELVYWDFECNPLTHEQYKAFLASYYKDEAHARYERTMWYHKHGNYKLLLALKDGVCLGQACAYRVNVRIDGHSDELWWGVDTFVLPAARGEGMVKKLQKKLLDDFPNFSSVWYSKANGFIKRKSGAHELLKVPFNYFPVSSFFTVLTRVFVKHILYKHLSQPAAIWKDKYYVLNNVCRGKSKFEVMKVDLAGKLDELSALAEYSLKEKDFYVVRDADYLAWKYLENPTIGNYHALFFYTQGKELAGVIIFSSPYKKLAFSIPLTVVTILDCFVLPHFGLDKGQMLREAMHYHHEKGIAVDGILALGDFPYRPLLRYPWGGIPLLTNFDKKISLKSPYLSYSDQDMEQAVL